MGDVETDQPIGKSWSSDWAKAEQQAAAFEANQSDSAESAGGQSNEEQQEEQHELRASEDGSSEGEANSGQGGEQTEPSSQPGEEPSGGDEQDGGDGDPSQQGGALRGKSQEKVEAKPRAERIKALRAEAAELGMEFEGNSVIVSERAKFREAKRNFRNKLAAERQQFEEEARKAATALETKAGNATRLQAAIEANDLDGVAEAMGVESWNHLTEQALKRKLNPEHKELMRLRREKRDTELQGETDKKTAAAQQAAQKQAQARETYRESLSTEVAKTKKYKAFANDPMFIAGVLKYQEKNWDGEETISINEASALAMKDARLIYDKLHQRFGGQAALQPANTSASGTVAEKPGHKAPPKTVSQSEVADASGNDNSGDFDEAAWSRKWTKQIASSEAQT